MSGSHTGDGNAAVSSAEEARSAIFERERRRLFSIAYRMLGSVHEAEDLLQDAYIRWHGVDVATVENSTAYLVSLVTRLCIDALRSAHERRLSYVGQWLPEPLVGVSEDLSTNPERLQEVSDDLSIAFLLMLERLNPVERAVFLLHECFDFSYREIGEIVDRSEENCRQIERRARQHLGRERRVVIDPEEHDRLARKFFEAMERGDLEGLLDLLSADVVMYADGGGKVAAARTPIRGREKIARTIIALLQHLPENFSARLATVNGTTGILGYEGNRLHTVFSMLVVDGKIEAIYSVGNPEKL
jgi:RNA polymerase sigma-70 factor (ECF subfamily)